MRSKLIITWLAFFVIGLLCCSASAFAAQTTWTGAANSTDWFDASNWSAGVPAAADDADVPSVASGQYPWIVGAAVCNNLTVQPGAWTVVVSGTLAANVVSVQGLFGVAGGAVTIAGDTTVTGNSALFIMISGTVQCQDAAANTFQVGDALGSTASLQIRAGTCLVSNLQVYSGANLQVNGAGILGASRDWTSAAGTIQQNGGVIGVFGATNASVSVNDTVGNFWIFKQAGAKAELSADLHVAGDLVVQAGVLDTGINNYNIDNDQNLYLNGGALNINAATLRVGGSFQVGAGLFNPGNGSVIYDGNGAQTIAALSYNTLIVDKLQGVASLAGSSLSAQDVTVTDGDMLSMNSTWNIFNSLTVQQGAKATFNDSNVYLGDPSTYGSMTVAGELVLTGSGWNSLSAIQATDTNFPWSGTVTGTLECEYFQMSDISGLGLDCTSATIRKLQLGTLSTTELAGTMLQLGVGTQFDAALIWSGPNGNEAILNGLTFNGDNTSAVTNVEALTAVAPPVTFTNYDGPLGGEAYENDPTSSVNWSLAKVEFSTVKSSVVEGGSIQIAVVFNSHPSPMAWFPRDTNLLIITANSSTAKLGIDYSNILGSFTLSEFTQQGVVATIQLQTMDDSIMEELDVLDLHLQLASPSWSIPLLGRTFHRVWLSDNDSTGLFGVMSENTTTTLARIDSSSGDVFRCTEWESSLSSISSLTYDSNHDRFYAMSDKTSELVTVNPFNGHLGVVCRLSRSIKSLAYNSNSDILYAFAGNSPPQNGFDLISIDPNTGAVTVLGTFNLSISGQLLAYDPVMNLLYTVDKVGLILPKDYLVSIDPSTANMTQIGLFGFTSYLMTSFTFNSALGLIQAVTVGFLIPEAWIVNPSTGAATGVGNLDIDVLNTIAYNSNDGKLYGARLGFGDFVEVDMLAGTTTELGRYTKSRLNCLAGDSNGSSGVVYGSRDLTALAYPDIDSMIFEMDTSSGEIKDLFRIEGASFYSMAQVASNNCLYAADYNSQCVFRIDPGTGNYVQLAQTQPIYSLAYDPISDTLFAAGYLSIGSKGLMSIDLDTGVSTDIGPTSVLDQIAFDPVNAVIIGKAGSLVHQIDPLTGTAVQIGSGPAIDGFSYDAGLQQAITLEKSWTDNSLISKIELGSLAITRTQLAYEDYTDLEALAYNPVNDKFYAFDSSSYRLVEIDSNTGSGKFIGADWTLSKPSVKGLAYDVNSNTLYGSFLFGFSNTSLVSIDLVTGTATSIGSNLEIMEGYAFDPNANILYATSGYNLYTIDTATGASIIIGSHNFPPGPKLLEGLAFDPVNNKLYGSYDTDLYEIDVTTGNPTSVTSFSNLSPKNGLAWK